MDLFKILGELLALANKTIDYIDSPEKRAKAKRDYEDKLNELKQVILEETDAEKRSQFIDMLIVAIKSK